MARVSSRWRQEYQDLLSEVGQCVTGHTARISCANLSHCCLPASVRYAAPCQAFRHVNNAPMGNLILICHAVPSGAQLSGIKLITFPGLDGSLCKWGIALNAGKGWCRPFKVCLAIAAGIEREGERERCHHKLDT